MAKKVSVGRRAAEAAAVQAIERLKATYPKETFSYENKGGKFEVFVNRREGLGRVDYDSFAGIVREHHFPTPAPAKAPAPAPKV